MDTKTIIKQLEKALECKEDKEMRLRVEVLVDMLKEIPERIVAPVFPNNPSPINTMPASPLPTYYETDDSITKTVTPDVRMIKPKAGKQKQINGAGAIIDNTEQITYLRPEGT